MAKTAALESKFGTVIGSQDVIITTDNSQKAFSNGEFDINGEWLSDTREPEFKFLRQTPTATIYTVKVEGWARRIGADQIDIDYTLLLNGSDKIRNKVRDNTYYSGDEMLLHFTSPVDGWLAVYLGDDDEEQTMQCLLPYDGQNTGAYPIKANTEYIFFSKEHAEPSCVDYAAGLVMESRKDTDFNIFYLIFSPNKFSGTTSKESKSEEFTTETADGTVNLMPRETDFKGFQKWLGKKRLSDQQMQVIKTLLAIKKQ